MFLAAMVLKDCVGLGDVFLRIFSARDWKLGNSQCNISDL